MTIQLTKDDRAIIAAAGDLGGSVVKLFDDSNPRLQEAHWLVFVAEIMQRRDTRLFEKVAAHFHAARFAHRLPDSCIAWLLSQNDVVSAEFLDTVCRYWFTEFVRVLMESRSSVDWEYYSDPAIWQHGLDLVAVHVDKHPEAGLDTLYWFLSPYFLHQPGLWLRPLEIIIGTLPVYYLRKFVIEDDERELSLVEALTLIIAGVESKTELKNWMKLFRLALNRGDDGVDALELALLDALRFDCIEVVRELKRCRAEPPMMTVCRM